MAESDLQTTLSNMLSETFRVPLDRITPDASLQKDLGLDSIDLVDLLALLNQKFDVYLTPTDLQGCETVSQFEERIRTLLQSGTLPKNI